MADLLEAAHTVWEEGINLAAGIAVVLAIAKLWDLWTGHKLIRELHDDIHQIKEALHIWDDGSAHTGNTGRKNSSTSLQSYWAKSTAAKIANRLKRRGTTKMDKLNKLILLPIIAQICIILKSLFGIEIGTDVQDAMATLIVLGIGLAGILMNRTSKKPDLEGME